MDNLKRVKPWGHKTHATKLLLDWGVPDSLSKLGLNLNVVSIQVAWTFLGHIIGLYPGSSYKVFCFEINIWFCGLLPVYWMDWTPRLCLITSRTRERYCLTSVSRVPSEVSHVYLSASALSSYMNCRRGCTMPRRAHFTFQLPRRTISGMPCCRVPIECLVFVDFWPSNFIGTL